MEQNIPQALVLHKTMILAKLNINIIIGSNLRNAQEIFCNFKTQHISKINTHHIIVSNKKKEKEKENSILRCKVLKKEGSDHYP